jgi:hypothetical protein
MSTINGMMNNVYNIGAGGNPAAIARSGSDSDGDNDGSRQSSRTGRTNPFATAILQALSNLGITIPAAPAGTTDSTTANSVNSVNPPAGNVAISQDQQQALSTFMHDLFSALHAQGTTSSGNTQNASNTGTDSDGDNDGSQGVQGYSHHGKGLNALASQLQSLVQQLSSTDTSTTGTAADTTGSGLQQDFNNLLASLGASDNQTSLSSFLGNLYDNLQANNPGANVTTQA